jgi:hypothetical protein
LLPLRHDPPFKHYIAIELVEKADHTFRSLMAGRDEKARCNRSHFLVLPQREVDYHRA